jgi:hypothetical protein
MLGVLLIALAVAGSFAEAIGSNVSSKESLFAAGGNSIASDVIALISKGDAFLDSGAYMDAISSYNKVLWKDDALGKCLEQ